MVLDVILHARGGRGGRAGWWRGLLIHVVRNGVWLSDVVHGHAGAGSQVWYLWGNRQNRDTGNVVLPVILQLSSERGRVNRTAPQP
jgi:hypothetical protein